MAGFDNDKVYGDQLEIANLFAENNTISSTDTNGPITLTPDGSGVVQISYATENAITVYGASGALSEVGPLTDGQLVIGSTGMPPVAGSLTSSGGTITIALGAGTINLETAGSVSNSFVTDAGTATPALGVLTVSGGTNMNTAGAASTVTINLDTDVLGLTSLTVDNLSLDGNSITSTDTNGDINLTPDGTGSVVISDIDVAAGEIDGTAIGANSPSTGAFTTLEGTQLTLDPGASGDSFVQFDINSTGEFRIGVDNTDDSFRISQGSALGTNDTFIITADGEVTKPLTPYFLAGSDGTAQDNVTGDNTLYTVQFEDELFDVGGDYDNSTGTFTAPVDGKYLFYGACTPMNLTSSASGCSFRIVTSNRTYNGYGVAPGKVFQTTGLDSINFGHSVTGEMDAADTTQYRISINGEGADTVDLSVPASNVMSFIGYLLG